MSTRHVFPSVRYGLTWRNAVMFVQSCALLVLGVLSVGLTACVDEPQDTALGVPSHDAPDLPEDLPLQSPSGMPDATVVADAGSRGDAATAESVTDAAVRPGPFTLVPIGFPMAGNELSFPPTAYPPTNQSPPLRWFGVPSQAKSLALVFRDLGNGAIKWIVWDIPPTVTAVPANISKVRKPPEVPGSSQLGSLSNIGYAGPGMGARLYDFTVWALTVQRLPGTERRTTAEIFNNVLPRHRLATSTSVVARNTRNLR